MGLTQVNSEGIKDGEVKNADMADDAVGIAELSATGTASSSTYLRGDNSWATVSAGTALTGSTDTTICTVTGANAIQGEANLTYDGTDLKITTDANGEGIVMYSSGSTFSKLSGDANRASENQSCLNIQANWDGTPIAAIDFVAGADTTNKDDGKIRFQTTTSGSNIAERMRIESDGNVKILDGDLVIGTSGHGIDFSATTDGSGTDTSEQLDDYEEGEWVPILNTGDFGVTSYATRYARYTKIGRAVHIVMYIMLSNKGSNSGYLKLWGLPYTNAASPAYNALSCWCTSMEIGGARSMIAYVNPGSNWCAIQKYNESSGDANWCTEGDLNNNSEIRLAGTYFI